MLLETLRWHGPAQVEFKIDSRDGTARLMEVNGRFWGTLDLSIQAGINFPLMVIDGDIDPNFEYKVGLRYRWAFPFGLLHAMETEEGWGSLLKFFRFELNSVSDFWLSDPLPTLAKVFYIARLVW
jgi:predicted ATP-grasp superfamily ATP-dependent carboligase